MLKIKCSRFKTTVDPTVACMKQCRHRATCGDYRAFIEQPPMTNEEEPMGDGQSHGAEDSQDAAQSRRIDTSAVRPPSKSKIKHQMVTFVETSPGSGLFKLENISLQDLVIINLADRRVIAATEATEF